LVELQRKAVAGGDCESAPSEGDPQAIMAEESQPDQANALAANAGSGNQDDETLQGMFIQRYKLDGFSSAQEALMNTAVPKAKSTVTSCKPSATCVASALDNKTFKYQEDLGLCGWTYPMAGTVKIGKDAFDSSKCCALESTVAHECSHTCFYT